jgi:hypothetical protein
MERVMSFSTPEGPVMPVSFLHGRVYHDDLKASQNDWSAPGRLTPEKHHEAKEGYFQKLAIIPLF